MELPIDVRTAGRDALLALIAAQQQMIADQQATIDQLLASLTPPMTPIQQAEMMLGRLEQDLAALRVEIDEVRRSREVAAITDTAAFQRVLSQARQVRLRRCPQCGALLPATNMFCSQCGAALPEEP